MIRVIYYEADTIDYPNLEEAHTDIYDRCIGNGYDNYFIESITDLETGKTYTCDWSLTLIEED